MNGGRTIMRKVIRKGKINGFEVSYALAKLGTVVLNVVHVVYG